MVDLFLVFLRNLYTVFIVVVLICILSKGMHKDSFFFTSLPAFDSYFILLNNSHSDWYEVESQCSLDLHFLRDILN